LHDDSRAKIHSRVKSSSDPTGAVRVKRHLLYREIYKNHVINEQVTVSTRFADARLIVEIKSSPRTNLASSQLNARVRERERERERMRKLQREYTSLGGYNEGISDVTGRLTHSVAFDKKREKGK